MIACRGQGDDDLAHGELVVGGFGLTHRAAGSSRGAGRLLAVQARFDHRRDAGLAGLLRGMAERR